MYFLIDDVNVFLLFTRVDFPSYRTPPRCLGGPVSGQDLNYENGVSAWSRWAAHETHQKPKLLIATCNRLHLQRGNMIHPLRCLSCPLSLHLTNNGCMCQNSERGTANGLELSASNCCFVFLERGSENRDVGGGKEKHAGSFSPLSWHLGFVEGFSPSHFPSIEK